MTYNILVHKLVNTILSQIKWYTVDILVINIIKILYFIWDLLQPYISTFITV